MALSNQYIKKSPMKHFLSFCFALLFCLYINTSSANCTIYNSDGSVTSPKEDALYKILSRQQSCPVVVLDFKSILTQAKLTVQPTMVANRGFHNPDLGSFSFFEIVQGQLIEENLTVKKGDFFFGHFTEAVDNKIVLDQTLTENKLMIELIVWDPRKQWYHFYELRGTETASSWFYRGDSLDALNDNQYLHRDPPAGTPKFGDRMRCSACHNSGGPIMKEIQAPHNDWWLSQHPLPLGKNEPDADVSTQMRALIDADLLSLSVLDGMQQLENSLPYQSSKKALSLQEQMRPVFCEVEINLQSDSMPLDAARMINIPSAFFITPFLYEDFFVMDKVAYEKYLVEVGMNFPETTRKDADHAWLIPVKGTSDLKAIQALIDQKIIDNKFAAAVLSTDLQNPVFSSNRCELLKFVPQQFSNDWLSEFLFALKGSDLPHAHILYSQLVNPDYTFEYYVNEAQKMTRQIQARLQDPSEQAYFFQKMIASRHAVTASEISQNPLGQILEPGFRVIFPEAKGQP